MSVDKKDNKDDKGYKHYEDEKVRLTSIPRQELTEEELKKEEDERKELSKRGLVIEWEGREFFLYGFTSWRDKTGDWVLHYKFVHKEHLILYLKTEHPESESLVELLKALGAKGGYQVSDIYDYIEDVMEISDKHLKGEIKLEDGVHPKMKEAIDRLNSVSK